MSAKRIWPRTADESADRNRVVELVQRVGRARLRWTLADLKREMNESPTLQLATPGKLWRHVRDLDSTLVAPVEPRLADSLVGAGGELRTPCRSANAYVLTERLREYQAGEIPLDDYERAYLAVWVAYLAAGEQPVTTAAVTRVLRDVRSLRFERERQTNGCLQLLARREDPVVRRHRTSGKYWVRWSPLGPAPDRPEFMEWVEQERQSLQLDPTVQGRLSPTTSAARELVLIAVRASRSVEWPYGHPVRIEDLRAVGSEDPTAAALLDRLKQKKQPLASILSEASRSRQKGTDTPVLSFSNRTGERCHYDIADEPGVEYRRLYLLVRELGECLVGRSLELLDQERRFALQVCRADSDPVERAIGAVRVAACWRELARPLELIEQLRSRSELLSEKTRERVEERALALRSIELRWGFQEEAEEAAAEALSPLGRSLDEVLAVPRPLITAEEYAEWVPPRRRMHLSAADFLAMATTLRRYPNPRHTHRNDPDPRRAALTGVDRVEALAHLAGHTAAKTYGLLQRGYRLIGPSVRDEQLVRQAAISTRRDLRSAGMAAMVLLGDDQVISLAYALLADREATPDEIVQALHILLLMRRVERDEWPERICRSRHPLVTAAILDVISAARDGRWLLQR